MVLTRQSSRRFLKIGSGGESATVPDKIGGVTPAARKTGDVLADVTFPEERETRVEPHRAS
jgi:hypothetical protein